MTIKRVLQSAVNSLMATGVALGALYVGFVSSIPSAHAQSVPMITSGPYGKLQTTRGVLTQSGHVLENDGLKNVLLNPSFEITSQNWTADGGSTFVYVTQSANVAYGVQAAAFTGSAGGQCLSSDVVTIPNVLNGVAALGKCSFKGTAGNYTLSVYSNGLLAASATIPASTQFSQTQVQFSFPSTAPQTVQLKVCSTVPAAILYIDECSIQEQAPSTTSVFGADALPNLDNTYSLGSALERWKNLYVGGATQIDGSVKLSFLGQGVVHSSTLGVLSSSQILDADVNAAANIARSKIAATLPSQIIVNDGGGALSSIAVLDISRGGTGLAALGAANQFLQVNGAGTALTYSTITTDQIPEGAVNKYATNANMRAAVSASAPIVYNAGTGQFSIPAASGASDGYLSAADWTSFNGKQNAGNYITSLTGEAVASGPGAAAVTLANSAVIAKLLTGLNTGVGGTVLATDSIVQAFGKLEHRVAIDDTKISGFPDPMTTDGDIITFQAGSAQRLPLGVPGQVLTSFGGLPTWRNSPAGFANPMTTPGDMIYEDGTSTPNRLPIGTNGQYLQVVAGFPAWVSPTFALTNLSNLTPTAINQSLIPGLDNTIDLGTNLLRWRNLYVGSLAQFSYMGAGIVHSDVSGNLTSSAVNLASDVTGVLPIANGGTGQSTAPLAFGALSPLTTKGDLLGFDVANIRLPVGTDHQALLADSTQASGVKWTSLIHEDEVYVDFFNGSDVTGNGSELFPWKTLQFAYNSITPSINEPYVIHISGGNNDTDAAPITGKPNVTLWADYSIQVSQPLTISGGITNDNIGFNNIIFVGAVNWVRNDATTMGVYMNNTEFFSGPTLKQTGTGTLSVTAIGTVFVNADFLLAKTGSFFTSCSFLGANTLFEDTTNAAYYEIMGGYISSNVHVSGGAEYYASGVQCDVPFGCAWTGTTTVNGTPIIQSDSSSIPLTLAGAYTLELNSYSKYVNYSPATPADWNTVPTLASGALDTLASSGVVKSQAQNLVLASPNGVAGIPSFRSLVAADLPAGAGLSIGALDSQPANANGLSLSSSVLSTQSADATHPGMLNTIAQTIAGSKTWNAIASFVSGIATNKRDESSAAVLTAMASSSGFTKLTATVTDIQGIVAGIDGQIMVIYNNTGGTVTLRNENAGATAANRLHLAGATDLALTSDQSASLIYDITQARWVMAGGSGSGGGGTTALGVNAEWTLEAAVTPFTSIGGAHYQQTTQSLTSINISMLNSGTSGSTTVRINQYRAGALLNSATASLASSSGNPAGTSAALSGTLSLIPGDITTCDVLTVAGGTPDTITVQYLENVSASPSSNTTISALFPFRIGTAAQVLSGVATHSTFASAQTAAADGDMIMFLEGSFTENIIVTKQLRIKGMGHGSYLIGTVEFTNTANYAAISDMRIGDNMTLDTGVADVSVTNIWFITGKTATDNGTGSYIQAFTE